MGWRARFSSPVWVAMTARRKATNNCAARAAVDCADILALFETHGVDPEAAFLSGYERVQDIGRAGECIDFYIGLMRCIYRKA